MFMFDENNPMVVSSVMAMILYGMKIEEVPNLCGLRGIVQKIYDEQMAKKEEQK